LPASKYLPTTTQPPTGDLTPATAAPELETATRLRIAIARLSRRLRPTTATTEAGLTPTKTTILLHIVREGPIRLSELAESEGINPTMLSRAISTLAEAGLVERSSDEGDRRAAWVTPTQAGRDLAQRIRRERTDALNLALSELTPEERRCLQSSLPALERLAEALRGQS
jgi:DNA-binding MarR family transcriptional regulator